jgi:hypothetical protein
LYSANNPESNGLYSGFPDDIKINSPAEMLAYSRECSDKAKAFIVENPDRFFDLAWRKFLHTWGSEATFAELINWHGESHWWIKYGCSFDFLTGWSALVLIWTLFALRRLKTQAPLSSLEAIVGVVVLSNALVYVVFEGGDRHHLPFVPLVAVLLVDYCRRSSRDSVGNNVVTENASNAAGNSPAASQLAEGEAAPVQDK